MYVIVPAWKGKRPHNRDYLELRALLDVIGANDWTWHLDELDGVSRHGAGIDLLALEALLETGESVAFSWVELLDFADQMHQVIDGRLSAHRPGHGNPVLVVEARDSTDWKVTARDDSAPAWAAANRVAALNR